MEQLVSTDATAANTSDHMTLNFHVVSVRGEALLTSLTLLTLVLLLIRVRRADTVCVFLTGGHEVRSCSRFK